MRPESDIRISGMFWPQSLGHLEANIAMSISAELVQISV